MDDLTRKQAAAHLGLCTSSLKKMALQGGGPRYLKRGKFVFYQLADLDEWQKRQPSYAISKAGRGARRPRYGNELVRASQERVEKRLAETKRKRLAKRAGRSGA